MHAIENVQKHISLQKAIKQILRVLGPGRMLEAGVSLDLTWFPWFLNLLCLLVCFVLVLLVYLVSLFQKATTLTGKLTRTNNFWTLTLIWNLDFTLQVWFGAQDHKDTAPTPLAILLLDAPLLKTCQRVLSHFFSVFALVLVASVAYRPLVDIIDEKLT